jgi:hypothetical protein
MNIESGANQNDNDRKLYNKCQRHELQYESQKTNVSRLAIILASKKLTVVSFVVRHRQPSMR